MSSSRINEATLAYSMTKTLGFASPPKFCAASFNMTNVHGMQQVFKFLLVDVLGINLRCSWPLVDRKQQQEFVQSVHRELKVLQEQGHIPKIIPLKSCLQACQGHRFISLWYFVAKYALAESLSTLQPTFRMPTKLAPTKSAALRPSSIKVMDAHIAIEQEKFLANAKEQVDCHAQWKALSAELSEIHVNCCTELAEVEQELKALHKTSDAAIVFSAQGAAARTAHKRTIDKCFHALDAVDSLSSDSVRAWLADPAAMKENLYEPLEPQQLREALTSWNQQLEEVETLLVSKTTTQELFKPIHAIQQRLDEVQPAQSRALQRVKELNAAVLQSKPVVV